MSSYLRVRGLSASRLTWRSGLARVRTDLATGRRGKSWLPYCAGAVFQSTGLGSSEGGCFELVRSRQESLGSERALQEGRQSVNELRERQASGSLTISIRGCRQDTATVLAYEGVSLRDGKRVCGLALDTNTHRVPTISVRRKRWRECLHKKHISATHDTGVCVWETNQKHKPNTHQTHTCRTYTNLILFLRIVI